MYCPKCKQTFEEGSRRFCPTDGARLISDNAPKRESGVFANLIPQMDAISDLGKGRTETEVNMSLDEQGASQADEIFFELDDEPVGNTMNEASFAEAARVFESSPIRDTDSPFISRPTPRKVNPYEISDGGVNLDEERPDIFTGDFDVSNPDSFIGRIVKGRYRVTEFLGGDESGLAYLGDDKIADRKVLVRILLQEESDEIMASILAEERISLSHLTHPNIARLVDSGEFTNGIQFLVSSYVDALSVRDIAEIHGRFLPERAARIIRQAASALTQAHQEGILHRDVRPENLILDTEGDGEQTIVVNFGASNGEPTEMNAVYKAPEVLDGRIATAGSDIYSLAVVAYEMLTGRMPFEGASTKEIVRSQYAGLSLRPTDVDPELPSAVNGVLEKAFSFNTVERYNKAREFGDAFYQALTDAEAPQTVKAKAATAKPIVTTKPVTQTLKPEPAARSVSGAVVGPNEPAWKNRSPEPPELESRGKSTAWLVGILALVIILAAGWWYVVKNPTDSPTQGGSVPASNDAPVNTISQTTEMPPQPRSIPQPANTAFYQNSKQNLKGDLLMNFVGFTLYYPKDWKVNGPQPGTTAGARGNFLDISREVDGHMHEQMLVSYYPSKGTFTEDAERFPLLVKETNDTLKKLLPGYQAMSEGEITINNGWKAYEVKFQGGGTSPTGEKLVVWGRRIFIPAARPGVRDGFMVTMLATSYADEIKSVDDVGVKGELAPVLYSFEPSQNF
ncbi:MAG TPA: protein kinase [Pyrinomonadaceae bacterium]|nr:protein kinase [Pyrinomonadaceae bacterium]